MKKFLFFALAAAFAFTSCTKDETLATAHNGAIGFAVAADNATRSYDPSITNQNIKEKDFAVYGWMNDYTGVVFRDELVSYNGTGWAYDNTQYWVADNSYYFAALAPSTGRTWTLKEAASNDEAKLGIGKVNFKNAGTQDLLYWAQGPIVGKASANPEVSIVFHHLLSKVKFTFANQFDNENVSIVVKNIVINQHPSEAEINLATANWWTNLKAWQYVDGQKANYEFGNAVKTESAIDAQDKIGQNESLSSYNEVLLFPFEDQLFNITYVVDLYMGQEIAATYEHKVPLTTTLKMGHAYNFKAAFNAENITGDDDETLEPIVFTVEEVDGWIEGNEVVVEEPTTNE